MLLMTIKILILLVPDKQDKVVTQNAKALSKGPYY